MFVVTLPSFLWPLTASRGGRKPFVGLTPDKLGYRRGSASA
ncbi:hypothetical protein NSU_2460 [Novosphingobium pentaromativorans US6-1]|uniref:Uncharacterized protein n=1 Tax=Novosphingobium pentaromativorans US6-1 TaxID=1088721 RepID=G6EDN8_9SPHN|nr:hypothetical protein NSU_2460 [Novosphingobium pentaromativorans US6-1]